MAMSFKGDAGAKRKDIHAIDPHLILVDETLRGRTKPPSDADIIARAVSIYDHGQLQAVGCRRRSDDKQLILCYGFTRTAAIRLIREGFTVNVGGEDRHVHDPDHLIDVRIVDANDEMAFVHNIIENHQRNRTSPIDDANNQKRLRERYGKSDQEIATLYDYDGVAKVEQLRALLSLERVYQEQLHDDRMTLTAALALLDVPAADRPKLVVEATTANGKVSGRKMHAAIRDKVLSDDASQGKPDVPGKPAVVKVKPRTIRELKEFFTECADTNNDKMKKFCLTLVAYINGQRKDETMERAIVEIIG